MKFTKQQITDEYLHLREVVKRQTRELETEAALELVRNSAMAMSSSDELNAIIGKVFTECIKMGIQLDRGMIMIFDPESLDSWWWMANPEAPDLPRSYHVPYNAYAPYLAYLKGWKERTVRWMYVLEGKEKKDWDAHIFVNSELSLLPIEVKQVMMGFTKVYLNASFNHFGCLTLASLDPMSDEHFDILLRFAQVFDLTYTRFNDLKQAETQRKEAQIEAALEKVRSRSLAMHHSVELEEVVVSLFDRLVELGLSLNGALIFIFEKENRNIQLWIATNHLLTPIKIDLPYDAEIKNNAIIKDLWNAIKNGTHIFNRAYSGKTKNDYFRYVAKHNESKIPESVRKIQIETESWTANFAAEKNSLIGLDSWSGQNLTIEDFQTLIRFARVFEQAYTRFLDLQKAEEQAREAQIEAALERVRARTMAMHNSSELAETASVLFQQFMNLGITPKRCLIGIMDKKNQSCEFFYTGFDGKVIPSPDLVPMNEQENLKQLYNAWLKNKDHLYFKLVGQQRVDWTTYIMEKARMHFPEYKPDKLNLKQISSVPAVFNTFFFAQGFIMLHTVDEIPEPEISMLKRFSGVFDQTYTRFLDLQKAEAQAKEAIKASSLDRVRAEIASMRTVHDLQRITPIIWHELIALGVPFVRCGVFIINESSAHVQIHLSSPEGNSLATMDLPFDSNELTLNTVNHWREGLFFKTHWNKEEFVTWMQTMIEEGQVQNRETYQGASQPPESLDLHFVPFKQGMLYVGNISPLEPEELQLVKSLAGSFSIAYARYEDFRQLEEAKNQIEKTLTELKATQAQLIQSEKMASLGELTAGIAHEIQNPLNFVNNFSEVSCELLDEMKDEIDKGNYEEVEAITKDVKQNLEKILYHGKRADGIVKGMLLHSRSSSGVKEPTDINKLADEYLRLTYHGLKAKDKSFNATMKNELDHAIGKINVTPQEMGRVFMNLLSNAFYAVNEKRKLNIDGYEPTVTVSTKKLKDKVEIKVSDNGNGIPQSLLDKVFQPFFTTKPSGEGTGLGLSLSYDIVTKGHGGELKVDTKEGEYTTFIIDLPV